MVFVFKMSKVGPGSGIDLVMRMQASGDLQDSQMMFDHVKRVKEWTTMACHVYDSTYYRMMTIACCDMLRHAIQGLRSTSSFLEEYCTYGLGVSIFKTRTV